MRLPLSVILIAAGFFTLMIAINPPAPGVTSAKFDTRGRVTEVSIAPAK